MIADLKPYPEYKESGSRWLGRVPSRWGVIPLGRLLVQRIEQNRPVKTKDILSLSLRQGVIPYSEKKSGGNKAKDDLTAYTLAYPGDIVLNSMNVVVGSVGLSKYFGAVSPVYYVLHVRDAADSIHFFDALFQDRTFQQSLWGLGNGILFLQSKTTGKFNTIRMRIPMHALRRVVVPHPPPDEQAAMVRFLGWANRRLERAIQAKRKVIALLNEQKQAIIHRAVTRGLDPSVPLKPSGIPWLGDIPQHWEVKRLKAIAKIRYGLGQPPRESETGLPLIRATNVDHGRILQRKMVRVDPADVPKTRDAFLKAGEIIVVRSGALTADSAIIPMEYEGAVAGYDMVVTVKRARAEFIAMALLSSYVQSDQLVIASMRAAQPHLNAEELGTAILLLPPDEEQKQVVEFVKTESSPISCAISRMEREIELLREYLTRLIADVVTGKLDVREAAALLPDEAPLDTAEVDADLADETEAADEGAAV